MYGETRESLHGVRRVRYGGGRSLRCGTHLAIRNRQGLCRVVGGAVPSGAESWRFDTNRLGYRGTGGHFVRRFSLPTVQSRWGTQGGKR